MSWPVAPLKRLVDPSRSITYGIVQAGPDTPGGIPYIRPVDMTQFGGVAEPKSLLRTTPEIAEAYRRSTVTDGDIVVSIGPSYGKVMIVPAELTGANLTQGTARVAPASTVHARYLYWALQAATSQQFWDSCVGGATFRALNLEPLGSTPVPLMPLEEQRRITNFLDVEISKVDDLVSKKERLVSLMDERIDSQVLQHVGSSQLVNRATGHPALPIRRILTKVTRPAAPNVGVITAYRDGQVTERSLRRAEGYTLSASTDPQGQSVRVDDVVVHGLDGFAGAIGTSESTGNCSPVYHVCVPTNGGDARFLGRLLRLLALQGYLGNFATSTRERAVDFRNWDLFGRIPIPVVSTDEQREIGDRITRLRPLRELVTRSESLAAERRLSLITAAVTGQFDVSTASGRNVTEGVSA